jgi:DNA-binding NarL/FixJ family response regulator
MLEEQPEFDLIGEALDAQGLLVLAEKHTPDLVLIDRELPGSPIEDLIDRLHALKPRPIVVVMSGDFQFSRVILNAGADAFVSKGDEPYWLLEKLHKYAIQVKEEDAIRPKKP